MKGGGWDMPPGKYDHRTAEKLQFTKAIFIFFT
jgi:hypothetical protein